MSMVDHSYRLYSLSPQGAITGATNREFADDLEAMMHASMLLANHHGVELWQTHRLVGRVERGVEESRALCA